MVYNQQSLEEIRKQRKRFQDINATSTKGARRLNKHQKPKVFWSKISRLFVLKDNAMWLSLGMVVVITSFMIAWWFESDQELDRNRLYDLGTLPPPAAGQTSRAASVEKMPRQTSAQGTTKPRGKTVIDAVATTTPAPLRKPNRAAPDATASTSLDIDSVTGGQSSTRNSLHTATSKAAAMERQDPVTQKQSAVSVDKNGPWVINLVSSSSRTDADRLAQKARSMDIQTEQQQVTVKGSQYWRVQITGFSTEEAASTYADIAKEKLGLKDVWILKR